MNVLRAGPLSLLFSEGDLRKIRLGPVELVQRIYFAVRDKNWNTIPARIEGLFVDAKHDSFVVSYEATHQGSGIDFRWRATIEGTSDGRIAFAAKGRAHATFHKNRIGFCVHHPLDYAGKPVLADGKPGVFPIEVSPHQPFVEYQSLRHEVLPGLKLELTFEGDLFEMEDHRNWSDGNYKTYSTPLRLPFPVQVPSGAAFEQRVALRLLGNLPARLPERPEARLERTSEWRPLPEIGFGYSPGGIPEGLRPDHLRYDWWGDAAIPETEVPLELAVHLRPGKEESQLMAAARARARLRRVLVFHERYRVTPLEWVQRAREALRGIDVVGGTDHWFAQLNRERPARPVPCAFPLCPQVHSSDELSIVENLASHRYMLETARRFLGGEKVHVSPVTLKPRFNPDATDPSLPSEDTDPRQASPFAAAWTLGALANLACAGADSLTFYELRGPRGLTDETGPYPLFELFREVLRFRGGEFAASSLPGSLFLRKAGRRAVLVANLSEEAALPPPPLENIPRTARIRRLGGRLEAWKGMWSELPGWGIAALEWEKHV